MDLIRAALKALFYDYPIEDAITNIQNLKGKDMFMIPFSDLVKWRETSFTISEIQSLQHLVEDEWMKPSTPLNYPSKLYHCFHILNHFSEKILRYENKEPKVEFEHLLRWREMTRCLGEDLFIIPFLATQDIHNQHKRTSFTWPNILSHNNTRINRLLDKGICDVHSHLGASADVFELNWLSLMNEVTNRALRIEYINKTQENPVIARNNTRLWGMHELCIAAAAIRVKLYRFLYYGYPIDKLNFAEIINIIISKQYSISRITDIQAEIALMRQDAFRLINGKALDYAIDAASINKETEDITSIYMVHRGERKLMYDFFRRYFNGDKNLQLLPGYIYLYELIKIRFRREFIQTNELIGFHNFKNYQDRKSTFCVEKDPFQAIYPVYAIQSSLRPHTTDELETRISTNYLQYIKGQDYSKYLFSRDIHPENKSKVGIVIHFLKKKDQQNTEEGKLRHHALREELKIEIDTILKNRTSSLYSYPIVGIDAAGSELQCRPEVFAQTFRYARLQGLKNMTFHAGEDFYDLTDGLRTIDEVLLFLEFTRGCRLGHALALGINATLYYKNRHNIVVMPQQILLDNLVWLYYKAMEFNIKVQPEIQLFIENQCFELYTEIGYKQKFNLFHYRNSMYLRGDNPSGKKVAFDNWTKAELCCQSQCQTARKDEEARNINKDYQNNANIKKKGEKTCSCKLPTYFEKIITQIQDCMMDVIAEKDIAIECNPTSNIMIGPFSKYEEHPIFRFYQIEEKNKKHKLSVSINTDDKGVFATSLTNEYSLIAMALTKQRTYDGKRKWDDESIVDYLHKIIAYSKEQRFR